MKYVLGIGVAVLLTSAAAMADKPAVDAGLEGVSFASDKRSPVRKAMDKQAQQKAEGGELSLGLYVRTQERLAQSFDQPIPEKMVESTRD